MVNAHVYRSVLVYIVHPENLDLTRKVQSSLQAEIAHASIVAVSLHAFICVCVFAFSCVCEYCSRSSACVRSRVRELHLKHIK